MTAVPMSETELAAMVTDSIRAAVAERGGVVLVPAEVAAELEQVRRENGRLREINAGLRAELEDLGERLDRAIYEIDHMLEDRGGENRTDGEIVLNIPQLPVVAAFVEGLPRLSDRMRGGGQ